ncbi:MAG: MFS transporter [Candidatus Binatus sp.]|uniref:MFS transporter n=1 Tax=Candidatus Binatus sp. TaxID=2811406 RepID=UPI0027278A86|nr:MFS transporter [Candidatus Binatus sp.]MDO8432506.1 MFS transporter [Candidatus Binatus sp.]
MIAIDTVPEIEAAEADEAASDLSDRGWTGRLTAFRSLRHRNFRLFFGGQLISLIGTWMQSVAQAWLVLKLTNSSLMLGVVSFASYMPIVLVALFAGVVVDHVDRRRLIIGAQVLLMISAFILAGLTWAGAARVEYVIILAALNGLVSSFDMPGRQAFVVEMVGREDLPNAIAINSMIFNGARMVGPAVAGLSIAVIGVTGCFFLNGLSFIAVIWSLLQMDLPRRERRQFGATMMRQVRLGLSYVWRHRPTLWLLILVAINMGFGMQYTVLIPMFARDLLHSGVRGYGFLMAAQGLGAVASAVVMNSRSSAPKALRQNLVFGIFCMAISVAAFGFSRWMALSLIAQMFIGAGLMNHMVTTNTLLQLFVSDELRGRVMSIYTLSFIGTAPVGSLAVGFIGEHFNPRSAVYFCAIFSLLCGFLLLTKLKLIASAQEEPELANA